VTEITESNLHCASMYFQLLRHTNCRVRTLGRSNVRKVMSVYIENNTESIGSMHCGRKIVEIRVFGKAVSTRTTAPSFRKAQIEHCRSSQGKNSHNVVYMTEDVCD
jgi:hypothetical protein